MSVSNEQKPILICVYSDKELLTKITQTGKHEFHVVSIQSPSQLDNWLLRQENDTLALISVIVVDLNNSNATSVLASKIFHDKVKICFSQSYQKEQLLQLINQLHVQFALTYDATDAEIADAIGQGLVQFNYQRRLLNVIEELTQKQEKQGMVDSESRLYNKVLIEQHLKRDLAKSIRNYQDWIKGKRTQLLVDSDFIFYSVSFDQWEDAEQQSAILMQFSALLSRVFRELDSFVRMDDNLFLVVARFSHRFEAHKLAERLRKSIETFPFVLADGSEFHVTASIGFACFPFDITKPDQLTWQQVVTITQRCLFAAQQTEHNQWIGLHVNSSMKTNTLFERMLNEPQKLIDERELQLLTSMAPTTQIEWGQWLQQAV